MEQDNVNMDVESFIEKCRSRAELRKRVRKKRTPRIPGKSLADTIKWLRDNPEEAPIQKSDTEETSTTTPKTMLSQLVSDYKRVLQIETKLGESVLESIENAKSYNKHIQRVFNANSRESAKDQSLGSSTLTAWSETSLPVSPVRTPDNVSLNSHLSVVPERTTVMGDNSTSNEDLFHNSQCLDVPESPTIKGDNSLSNDNVSRNSHLSDVSERHKIKGDNSPDNDTVSHNSHLLDFLEIPIIKVDNSSEINKDTLDGEAEPKTNNDDERVMNLECSVDVLSSRYDHSENLCLSRNMINSENPSLTSTTDIICNNDEICKQDSERRSLKSPDTQIENNTVEDREGLGNVLPLSPEIVIENNSAANREDSESRSLKSPANVTGNSPMTNRKDSENIVIKSPEVQNENSRVTSRHDSKSVSLQSNRNDISSHWLDTDVESSASTNTVIHNNSAGNEYILQCRSPNPTTHSRSVSKISNPGRGVLMLEDDAIHATSMNNTQRHSISGPHAPTSVSESRSPQQNLHRKSFCNAEDAKNRRSPKVRPERSSLHPFSNSPVLPHILTLQSNSSSPSHSEDSISLRSGSENDQSVRPKGKSSSSPLSSSATIPPLELKRNRSSSRKSEDSISLRAGSGSDLNVRHHERRNSSRRSSNKTEDSNSLISGSQQDLKVRHRERRNGIRSSPRKSKDPNSARSESNEISNFKHQEQRDSNISGISTSEDASCPALGSQDLNVRHHERPNSNRRSCNKSEDFNRVTLESKEDSNHTYLEQRDSNTSSPCKSRDFSSCKSGPQDPNIIHHEERERFVHRVKRVQNLVPRGTSRQVLYDLVDNIDEDTYSALKDLSKTLHNPLKNKRSSRKEINSVILPSIVSMVREYQNRNNEEDVSEDDGGAKEDVPIHEENNRNTVDDEYVSPLELDDHSDVYLTERTVNEFQEESQDVSNRTYQFIGLSRERAFTDPEIIQRKLRPCHNCSRQSSNLDTEQNTENRATSPDVLISHEMKHEVSEKQPNGGDTDISEVKNALCLPDMSPVLQPRTSKQTETRNVKLPSIPTTVSKEYLRSKTCLRKDLPLGQVVDKYKQIQRIHKELESFRCYGTDDSHVNVNVLQRCDNSYDVTLNWGAQNNTNLTLERTNFTKEEDRSESVGPSPCPSLPKRKPKRDFIYLDDPQPQKMFFRQLTNKELSKFLKPSLQNVSTKNAVTNETWELGQSGRSLLARSKHKNFKRFFKGNVRSK